MNIGFNLEAKKYENQIATGESRKTEKIGNLVGDAVSFPEWREAGSFPYRKIAICKIGNDLT